MLNPIDASIRETVRKNAISKGLANGEVAYILLQPTS
jgi:hypothetical protein